MYGNRLQNRLQPKPNGTTYLTVPYQYRTVPVPYRTVPTYRTVPYLTTYRTTALITYLQPTYKVPVPTCKTVPIRYLKPYQNHTKTTLLQVPTRYLTVPVTYSNQVTSTKLPTVPYLQPTYRTVTVPYLQPKPKLPTVPYLTLPCTEGQMYGIQGIQPVYELVYNQYTNGMVQMYGGVKIQVPYEEWHVWVTIYIFRVSKKYKCMVSHKHTPPVPTLTLKPTLRGRAA